MKNIQSIVAAVKGKVFKLSCEKINQVERNSFKNEILAALVNDLQGIGGIYRTNDGVILEVSNDELGVIHLEFDVKVKNTDFDVTTASDEYQQTITARVERVQEAAKRKAERLAKSKKQLFTEQHLTEYALAKTTYMRGSEGANSRRNSRAGIEKDLTTFPYLSLV